MNRILIYRKILILMLLCGVFEMRAVGQMVNKGEVLFVATDGLIFIDGNYKHLANIASGSIFNNGRIAIKGDWYNEDNSVPPSTIFDLRSIGSVDLTGSVQTIKGISKTAFPNLILSGTGNKILSVNTDVFKTLSLGTKELQVGSVDLSITNPLAAAIVRSTGFVSTDNNGRLIRSTNAAESYLYPLGSSSGTSRYRPLEIEPIDVNPNTFAATFVNKDPDVPYTRSNKRPDIQTVFDKYYYLLNQITGTSNSTVRFYQTAEEAEYRQLVSWSTFNLWEKAGPSSSTEGSFGAPLTRFLTFISSKPIKNGVTPVPFTFATSAIVDNPLTFFNAFSPDGDNKNDKWVINNIDLFPDNTLTIFNRWGDEVFKSKSYSSLKAWDGGNLNSGTYFYVLNVDINGTPKTYKGFINLVKKN